jgi:hypothetical protein
MPKITLKTSEVGCRKPGCKHRLEKTARHHRRCETMFIRGYAKRADMRKTQRYQKLCQRYDRFDPKDVVVLCEWHHCEIHLLYDPIISERRVKLQKVLGDFTWGETDKLMSQLRKLCLDWEKKDTPGRDPKDCEPYKRFPAYIAKRRRKRHA